MKVGSIFIFIALALLFTITWFVPETGAWFTEFKSVGELQLSTADSNHYGWYVEDLIDGTLFNSIDSDENNRAVYSLGSITNRTDQVLEISLQFKGPDDYIVSLYEELEATAELISLLNAPRPRVLIDNSEFHLGQTIYLTGTHTIGAMFNHNPVRGNFVGGYVVLSVLNAELQPIEDLEIPVILSVIE